MIRYAKVGHCSLVVSEIHERMSVRRPYEVFGSVAQVPTNDGLKTNTYRILSYDSWDVTTLESTYIHFESSSSYFGLLENLL